MAENTVTKSEPVSGSFSASSFMNTTTIHIIAEIIAICGMGVYFHSRIGKLVKQNQELLERLEEQEEAISKHEELLEKIVAKMNTGVVTAQPKKTSKVSVKQSAPPPPEPEDDPPAPSPMSLIADIMSVTAGKFGPVATHVQSAPPMPSIQELDNELENELQDLKEEKKQ